MKKKNIKEVLIRDVVGNAGKALAGDPTQLYQKMKKVNPRVK